LFLQNRQLFSEFAPEYRTNVRDSGKFENYETLYAMGGKSAGQLPRISREHVLNAYKAGPEAVISLVDYLQEQFQSSLDELGCGAPSAVSSPGRDAFFSAPHRGLRLHS
jgi:hypothetical protein